MIIEGKKTWGKCDGRGPPAAAPSVATHRGRGKNTNDVWIHGVSKGAQSKYLPDPLSKLISICSFGGAS